MGVGSESGAPPPRPASPLLLTDLFSSLYTGHILHKAAAFWGMAFGSLGIWVPATKGGQVGQDQAAM